MKLFKSIGMAILSLSLLLPITAQERAPWENSPNPEITKIALKDDDPSTVVVDFNLETPRNNSGADYGEVVMTVPGGNKVTAQVGKTRKVEKSVEFTPYMSGTYKFIAYGCRNEIEKKHESLEVSFDFTLPLAKTSVTALNLGKGEIKASWSEVNEAEAYILNYTDSTGTLVNQNVGNSLEYTIKGLSVGTYSDISVTAVRGDEKVTSDNLHKLIKDEAERVWNFTWFGQSSNGDLNTMKMINPNELTFSLNSCTFDSESGNIAKKGGKFTSFHDGISYYYTVINPKTENFELSATVKVDYINQSPDGQEGFGIIAMDSLGDDKSNSKNHYTNSAGILSWKYTTHVNGAKKEIKDGIGARFVTGLTPEVINMGDAGIAEYGVSTAKAFSYDQASDAVKTGGVYRITLKKDNTGYRAIFAKEIASEDTITQYTLYDADNVKLCQLDKDHVYLGFAVARGVNATFSDIVLNITDPKQDAPAEEEPPELVPLTHVVNSPTTYYRTRYPFVYTTNSDGHITIKNKEGKIFVKDAKVKANVDFKKIIRLSKNMNDIFVEFTPDENYKPGKHQVIAQYNSTIKDYEESYKTVTDSVSVIVKSYRGGKIYVSPNGDAFGKGTKESPLDLDNATKYVKPGQKIVLTAGTYNMTTGITIERGNNGTFFYRKHITTEKGERAVLDFSGARAGFINWGNYWIIENIDITKTVGNIKGMQIGGSNNIVRKVNTYSNGDTGLQISGASTDDKSKWPRKNLIYGCTSYDNCDPAQNNADGFAAKLTCREGNIFRYCIAYCNIDDGWDLFSKIESGPIGQVIVDRCIAYRNGSRLDGSGKGDGNGFKMGGDGIAVPHILRNSVTFENGVSGITSNSNPALQLENVTSFGNKGTNIALYGKGTAAPRQFKATGVLSINGVEADNIREQPELLSRTTYFYNGAESMNSEKVKVDESIFESIDTTVLPEITANGKIDMHGLFVKNNSAPKDAGAIIK